MKEYRIIISCPNDVIREVDLVKELCKDITDTKGREDNFTITVKYWENLPKAIGITDTQTYIDTQIASFNPHIYLGIMWKKYGSEGPGSISNTEHEYNIALDHCKESKSPVVTFFFKQTKFYPQTEEEYEQFGKVLNFKKKIQESNEGPHDTFKNDEEFKEKVQTTLEDIIKKREYYTKTTPKISKKKFNPVDKYIEQYIRRFTKKDNKEINYFSMIPGMGILELLNNERKIVLLGDAGIGKTIALEHIAHIASGESFPYYPELVHLNVYTNQKIEELLPPEFSDIQLSQSLILLDGLDEIESTNKFNAIRNIEIFAKQNPEIRIIITCRTNFYQSQTDSSTGTLKEFYPYILLPPKEEDVIQILENTFKKYAKKIILFLRNNNLFQLVLIPLYLTKLVKLSFKEMTEFLSKSHFLEQIFITGLESDIEHFRLTLDLDDSQEELIDYLEYLALGMEILGRNYLTRKESVKFIPNKEIRNLLVHSSAFKIEKGILETISFAHNSLQEYLAARVLSRLPFEEIKTIISFKPEFNKIIPTWINTLSFLFSILDKSDPKLIKIHKWIQSNEPELLVNFEHDKVDETWRVKIFKDIFNSYKENDLRINRSKFRYKDLASFGKSDEVIDFLLTEVETSTKKTNTENSIELLAYSILPPKFSVRAGNTLLLIATTQGANDSTVFLSLIALAEWNILSEENIKTIMEAQGSTSSDYIRAGLYYLLDEYNLVDKHIDIIISGFQFISHRKMFQSEKSRLGDEIFHLHHALNNIKTPNSIIKVIKYLIKEPEEIDSILRDEYFEKFIDNAVEANKVNSKIINSVNELFEVLIDNFNNSKIKQALIFYDSTNKRLDVFKEYMNLGEKKKNAYFILGSLADKKAFTYIIEQYMDELINDDFIWQFQQGLNWYNSDLFSEFNKMINEKTNNKFTLPPKRDYELERETHLASDIDLLFDKDSFIQEIKRIFKSEGKDKFTSSELSGLRNIDGIEKYSQLARQTLREFTLEFEDEVTQRQSLKNINSWNWKSFTIQKLYAYHSHHTGFSLSKDKIEWIRDWCIENVTIINFKTALVPDGASSYSSSKAPIYLWYFHGRYSIKYPENILLDMLSFDWIHRQNFGGITNIEKEVGEEKTTERILKNLSEGIPIGIILRNHLNYCKKKHLIECIPFLPSILLDENYEHDTRKLSLDLDVELTGNLSEIEHILPKVNDEFKWTIFQLLIDKGSKVVTDHLLELLQNDDILEGIQASKLLIKLNNLEGLKFYADWLNDNKDFKHDYFDKSPLDGIKDPNSIPILMELLELSYDEDLIEDEYNTLNRAVMNTLSIIALSSDENYGKIIMIVKTFVKENIKRFPSVKFLRIDLEQLEQRFYVNKSLNIDVAAAIDKLSLIYKVKN